MAQKQSGFDKTLEDFFIEKKCEECGKPFLITRGWIESYAYKLKSKRKTKFFCSWHCFKPNSEKRRKVFCRG